VAHAHNRADTATQLASSLRKTVLLGPHSNQAFLAACLMHPTFSSGQATTAFVGEHSTELLAATPPLPAGLAALVLYVVRALRDGHDASQVALPLAWAVPLTFILEGTTHRAAIQALGGNRYRVQVGPQTEDLVLEQASKDRLTVVSSQGRSLLHVAWDLRGLFVSRHGRQSLIQDHTLHAAGGGVDSTAGLVRAAMSGRIVALHVQVGQVVAKGAQLVVLEAMKMEHPSYAPMAATVTSILVTTGAQVAAGTLLVELEAIV
jgi:geranyl-CoA carboxylase alpha subunit